MMFSGVYAFLLIWSIFVYKYSVLLLCLMQRHEIFVLLFCFVLFPVYSWWPIFKNTLTKVYSLFSRVYCKKQFNLVWKYNLDPLFSFCALISLVDCLPLHCIRQKEYGQEPWHGSIFFSLETRQVDLILTFCLCKTLLIEQEGQLIRRITLQRFRFEQQLIPKDN